MNSKTLDILMLATISAFCFLVIVFGGLEHPNTLAGTVAKFVFSLK